jgi:hypothetical protein
MIRQSEDSQGRADSFDSAQDELAQLFLWEWKNIR